MTSKLIVGPIEKGLRTDRLPFNIDNDSFPTLINAYQWRSRIKRKRGTTLLGRLSRFLVKTNGSGNATITINPHTIPTGIVSFQIGADIFIDPGTTADPADQILITNNPAANTSTLNRVTGVLTIVGSKINTAIIYYPTLPVMGLEDFNILSTTFPGTIAFDTDYSYNISPNFPYTITDVSFYKNPSTDGTNLPGYVPKSTWTPTTWNGQNYQQFWTTNYEGAMWATNGIDVPFTGGSIGMQFAPANTITYVSNTPTTIELTITGSPLVVGDFVFLNEWGAPTPADETTINFQSGYITSKVGDTYIITLPFANLAAVVFTPGIVQYLTNRSDTTKDCLRWYDGSPTNGNATNPVFQTGSGWVNFMPPLSNFSYSVAQLPLAQYYLVGARMIFPFKDRLLFIGPVVQTSTGSPIYLQDTVIYSQNGTPYYNASFIGDPVFVTTDFHTILAPVDQTATAPAWFEDQTGFGGFASAGLGQPIITCSPNEDALILGFGNSIQTRFIYSGDDILPFSFYVINSEYGSASTFSIINLDKGVMTRGTRGFVITSQTSCQRFDLPILDQVFQLNLENNGNERFTAVRDFISEWVYFTYLSDQNTNIFPNQTLQYNYRDDSWAIFNESYTTYGTFRPNTGLTWNTLTEITWNNWTDPWNSSGGALLNPEVIGGNQQGFVLFRGSKDSGTAEDSSITIQNIVGSTITSPNHGLNAEDYITISGVQGTNAALVNGKVFSVASVTNDTFDLNPNIVGTITYLGGGLVTRYYVPDIRTKQFPVAWTEGRKVRIGTQKYLLTKTSNSQITLLIFLSQDSENSYNETVLFPNDALIYSTVLYTCPESTNLGLTPANINLMTPTATTQSQIWHRINTSLIGDTVQLGFTMSDAQMRQLDSNNQPINTTAEIELHGFILDVSPSQMLC